VAFERNRGKRTAFSLEPPDCEMWAQSDFVRQATAGVFTTGWMGIILEDRIRYLIFLPLANKSDMQATYKNISSLVSLLYMITFLTANL
jgi:hypothetical protein